MHGVGHLVAVAVQDLAAARTVHVGATALVVGLLTEFVADNHLHPEQAANEQGRHRQKGDAEPVHTLTRNLLL